MRALQRPHTFLNDQKFRGNLTKTCTIRGEREFPFPVIPKNGGLWFPFPNFGNGFFHSLPVPEFWEWIFFIPFPFPNFGNGIFSFPSHSRNLGMDFFIPFPFPNFGNGLFQFPSRSRTLKSHSRSPLLRAWVVQHKVESRVDWSVVPFVIHSEHSQSL